MRGTLIAHPPRARYTPAMTITRIFLQDAVGETRAAAIGDDGRAVALYMDRWCERGTRASWGDVTEGRLRKIANDQGGGFLELASGEEAFLQSKHMAGLTEGGACHVRIIAEARRDKLVRAELFDGGEDGLTRFERWQAALPGAVNLPSETGAEADDLIEAAFEEAAAPSVVLPGGGRLHVTPTPALVALDVDTAGRITKGRAASRAREVNLAAAKEAARQLSLRGLGGGAVLDCLGPMTRDVGDEIKTIFLDTFRAISTRKVRALAPSAFGLMEIALEWRERPTGEALQNLSFTATDESLMLDGLRRLEREARAQPAAQLVLELPDAWHSGLRSELDGYEKALKSRYGARIEIILSNVSKPEVSTR